MNTYLVIDQGTSSTKMLLYSEENGILLRKPTKSFQIPIKTIKISPSCFEQCPIEIMENIHKCLEEINFKPFSCSIVNQRESVLAWDLKSGRPLSNVICISFN
jgi:glycerol kinase